MIGFQVHDDNKGMICVLYGYFSVKFIVLIRIAQSPYTNKNLHKRMAM